MCYATCADSLCVVCWACPASLMPQAPHTPALLHPQNRPQTTSRGPNGQSGAAIAAITPYALAHCCSGGRVTQACRPIGPAPAAALHGRRSCPRCPFAPYLPYVAKRVLCMVAHACVGGDDTRDGYGLVWGMMGDDRVPMRTFCRRARRRNVELVGQFTSFSTKDPAIHERLGCGWGYWWGTCGHT